MFLKNISHLRTLVTHICLKLVLHISHVNTINITNMDHIMMIYYWVITFHKKLIDHKLSDTHISKLLFKQTIN